MPERARRRTSPRSTSWRSSPPMTRPGRARRARSSGGRACIPVTSWTGGGPGTNEGRWRARQSPAAAGRRPAGRADRPAAEREGPAGAGAGQGPLRGRCPVKTAARPLDALRGRHLTRPGPVIRRAASAASRTAFPRARPPRRAYPGPRATPRSQNGICAQRTPTTDRDRGCTAGRSVTPKIASRAESRPLVTNLARYRRYECPGGRPGWYPRCPRASVLPLGVNSGAGPSAPESVAPACRDRRPLLPSGCGRLEQGQVRPGVLDRRGRP